MQTIIHNGSFGREPGTLNFKECRHVRPWIRSLRGVACGRNTGNGGKHALPVAQRPFKGQGAVKEFEPNWLAHVLRNDKRKA